MSFRSNYMQFAFVVSLASAFLSNVSSVQAALVGYWNFDEGVGTTAADTSGNGFNGTLQSNATLPSWDLGGGASGDATDHALQFQGGTAHVGSQVNLGNPALLQLTGSRTTAFWLNGPLPASRLSVLGKNYSHEGTMHIYAAGNMLLYHGDEPNPAIEGSGAHSTVSSGTSGDVVTANTWAHVIYTRDTVAQTQEYYINGVSQGVQSWTARNPNTASDAPWRIGTGYAGTYDGKMDDVAFWNEQLTAGEAASLYQIEAQVDSALRAMGNNVVELDQLWAIYDGGPSNSGIINGREWSYISDINTSGRALGESWTEGDELHGYDTYLLLDLGTGSGVLSSLPGVPEPSSFWLCSMLGLLGLNRRRRNRKHSQA